MFRTLIALGFCLMSVGCASVMNDVTQPMKIETKSADGELVAGADCKLTNDYGDFNVKSGVTSQVRRSGKDLEITCQHPANPHATARAVSRANGALAGNILIGGVIGAVVDHNRGTAYTYPTWIQLEFGKALVFDRSWEADGKPVGPGTRLASAGGAALNTAPGAQAVTGGAVTTATGAGLQTSGSSTIEPGQGLGFTAGSRHGTR